jgi:hypothetical protein
MKQDLSNSIAAEMDKVLNSDENKEMFSNSSMLEKLAFKKVSEQDQVSEVEMELDSSLKKTAGCCECGEDKKHECDCHCHKDAEKEEKKASVRNPAREAFNALLKVSEDLESAGFERLAAASILLADKLITEAKAKSSKKSEKTKEPEKSKSKPKSKSKKMDMKERMEKMRKMQKGKKDSKKSEKK